MRQAVECVCGLIQLEGARCRGCGRRRLSSRPRKLTEAQEIELRAWYYSPRTIAEKAKQLGIGRTSAYAYIKRLHKPRKESVVTEHQCSVSRLTQQDEMNGRLA